MGRAKGSGGVNKMGLVREALAELGADAKPKAIAEYLQTKHGMEMAVTMISSYKSSITKKGGKKRGGGKRAGRPAAAAGGNVNLADLEQVHQLIERVGVPQLQTMIKVLTK